jgi:putative DNA methylase
MIERDFEIPFVAGMALREKQVQQNYRPVVAVHKWFARRPGTLFRALLLAEFGNEPVSCRFFHDNEFSHVSILDPFMGGGTTMLEQSQACVFGHEEQSGEEDENAAQELRGESQV